MPGALRTVVPRQPTIRVPVVDETIAPDDEYRYPWYVWTFVNTVAKGVATQHPNLPTRAIAMMQKSTRTVFFKQPNLVGAAALRDSLRARVADSSYWIAIADARTAVGCPPGWALGRLVFVVTLHAALVCPCLGVEPLKIGTVKQVFIDDRFINNPQGVKLVVNQPRLDHEKLIVPENPWEDQVVGGYTSVIQEGQGTHLWYEARSQQGDWSLAYAYSTDDGATFIKPKLGVIEFAGSTANNLVLDNSLGAHVFLMGPGSPAGAKYGLFIHIRANARNWMGREDVNSAFVSPDGIHWTPKGDVPFWKRGGELQLDSQNVIFWDTRRKKYVAFPRLVVAKGRAVGYSESDTFGNFSPPMPALLRDAADQVLEFYTSAAVQYPLAADAYYAFPAMLNGESGPVDIQFAASRDGAKWVRPDRRPIIHTGFDQAGNDIPYEKGSLYAGYGLTRKGDEVALYYTTLASLHVIPPPHSGIITRAIYRVDGFTSVNAADTPGQFSTGPLLFEGDRLELNCKTRTGGWLKVVILDKQGSPISGLTSDPITGDSVAMSITFGGSPDLSRLRGKPVQLRFLMCNADLYAFQVAISEPTK